MTNSDHLGEQRTLLTALYRTHVAPGSRYALVDFPDHANVGDSAIWLGELAMLRQVTGRD
ncbi:MAG: exopolysaccharide biosynthesis protein, partial [Sphingomonas sp.]